MMKFRERRILKEPKLVIIPMIDIMFFLLVFFMISTIYMVNLHTIPISLPTSTSSVKNKTPDILAITLKKNGTIFLNDTAISDTQAINIIKRDYLANPNLAIILRADKEINYENVIHFIDQLRLNGISRFSLAVNNN